MQSVWAIGDVQGCSEALDKLLNHPVIAADTDARYWFAGDIVNRGPDSLASLRRIIELGPRAVTVLGNHDLHLLATAAGVRKPGKGDTLDSIHQAADASDLIDWVRKRPLAHAESGHLLVHAGVLPCWSMDETLSLAHEVEKVLRGPNWKTFLAEMYGNKPRRWRKDLKGTDRLRVIVNALTRLRFCTKDGEMEFDTKGGPACAPKGHYPWFDVPKRKTGDSTVVFGHWSTLGLVLRPNLLALDTGCVWGQELTAIRLHDRKLVQVSCDAPPCVRKPREACS